MFDRAAQTLKARFGLRVLTAVRPIGDRHHDEQGFCSVCGRSSVFVFNSWVIPYDLHAAWADRNVSCAYMRRESLFCRACGSSLRVRRIADVLLSLFGPDTSSVAELVCQRRFRQLDVAEINAIGAVGALHPFLARLPNLAFSEYRGPERLGQIINGVRNEDICNLTYADSSFDLLLSSDTLEHVPDFPAALRETRRVLRPGGRHVFTVPVVASRTTTEARARINAEGEVAHLLPPLYHGRGAGLYRYIPVGNDLLTFTEFGMDLVRHIRDAGFEAEVMRAEDDPGGTGAELVFSGRVPD